MAITARELVFYIRAEDQASRVVKRAARSFGSLSTIRSLENKALLQKAANLRAIDKAQLSIQKNANAIQNATVRANRLSRISAGGTGNLSGFTAQETADLAAAAQQRVVNLQEQEKLLGKDLDEVRRKGLSASAALDQQISQAKLDRVRSYITEIQNLGRALRLLGVVGIAAFGFAAHAAAQFSTQVALAASQARPIGAPAGAALPIQANIQKEILKQMQQFPATAQDMANSFYQIFSGTNIQNVKQAAADVRLFNQAAVAGGASLDEMTQAGISIKNVFGVGNSPTDEFKSMTQALNVFFSAVRYGRMNAAQFASVLGYITPIAKDVHLSFQNIAEDMAFFTRQTGGNLTRQDAQGLARLIQLFARNDVVAGLAQKGIPVFDKLTGKMRPVVSILKDIHDQLHLTPQETVNFFKTISAAGSGKSGTQGTIQAIRIFSQGIQNAKAYQDVVKNVRKDNDEFINSYNQLSQAPGVRWKVFTNQLKAAILVIGGEAIPAFVKLGEPIAHLITWFNGLDEHTKHLIATVGVFGSVAAVLGGTLLVVAGSIAKMILTFKELRLLSLASEAGAASTQVIALRLGLAGLLIILTPLLIKLIGLKETLHLIGVIIGAMAFTKVIQGLAGIGTAAGAATGEVGALRSALLGINGLTVTAAVIITYESFSHRKQIKNTINKALGKLGLPGIGGANLPSPNDKASNIAFIKAALAHVQSAGDFAALQKLVQNGPDYEKKLVADFLKSHPAFGGPKAPVTGAYGALISAGKNAQTAAAQDSLDAAREALRNSMSKPGKTGVGGIIPYTNDNINQAIKNIVKLDEIAAKSHRLQDYEKAAAALKDLQSKTNADQFAAAQQVISALESLDSQHTKKAVSEAKKRSNALLQQLKDAQSNVMSMYDSLLQQNQSVMGQIFQGPYSQSGAVQNRLQYGGILSGSDLLKDLQSQNTQFTNFYSTINKLQKRGAPSELIQQLIQAGPQALPAIKTLSGMSDAQWKVYVNTFNKGQKLLHNQTVKQLKSQLKDYRKYGETIALQIIAGMRDKRLGLANEIKSIIAKMFGINTPVVTKATTKNIATATKAAKTKASHSQHDTYSGSTTNTKPVVGTKTRTLQSAKVEYHYHVTAPTSEHSSVETQLRHAEFASRTKYKGHN